MVEIICDTSFLIHLATKKIKNYDQFSIELGSLSFLVPNVVLNELNKLKLIQNKKNEIEITLMFIEKFKKLPRDGNYADKEILNFIKINKSFVGTMDRELKNKIKNAGSTIISFHNNNLIIE